MQGRIGLISPIGPIKQANVCISPPVNHKKNNILYSGLFALTIIYHYLIG